MMINADTKIASLLKHNPDALEAIVSISPRFIKLRNPVLRKLMAARASIAMASKIGGCSINDFFNKLRPIGFEIENTSSVINTQDEQQAIPAFLKNISPENLVELDVRPIIATGKDPLNEILKQAKALKTGTALKIINSFKPTPLIHLLGKQGFDAYVEFISQEEIHTFFYKKSDAVLTIENTGNDYSKGWDEMVERFNNSIETVDVRDLPMPLPMHTILNALDSLAEGKALFVYHKRIPVFLLPELEERGLNFRIKEISGTDVHLLIYRN